MQGGATLDFEDAGEVRIPRGNFSAVVAGNRLLLIGGDSSGSAAPLPIEWAPIDIGARPAGLSFSASSLPALRHPACAVVEDQVIVTGGALDTDG